MKLASSWGYPVRVLEELLDPGEVNEMYAAEFLEPGSDSFMLATICAVLHNQFLMLRHELVAVNGGKVKPPRDEDFQTPEDYLSIKPKKRRKKGATSDKELVQWMQGVTKTWQQ